MGLLYANTFCIILCTGKLTLNQKIDFTDVSLVAVLTILMILATLNLRGSCLLRKIEFQDLFNDSFIAHIWIYNINTAMDVIICAFTAHFSLIFGQYLNF